MINGIKQAWNSLVSFFAGIPAWWSNLWTQVGQFFTNFWNGIVSFFTQSIPAFIASVGQWFQQLPYNIGLALGTAIRNIINFGTAAWSWVTTQLPQIINGIIQWFQQLPGRIWTALTQGHCEDRPVDHWHGYAGCDGRSEPD
jgi:phage-related protein